MNAGALTPVDVRQLSTRTLRYARDAGCSRATLQGVASFIQHPVTQRILRLPETKLTQFLVEDVYKPRMHKMYAELMGGCSLDFELSVRRSPISLLDIRDMDPELWLAFQAECERRLGVAPYPPAALRALHLHFGGFEPGEAMLARAERQGVASVTWRELGGRLLAFSHGPAEASSHVETTLTQLVQEAVVVAQVRRLRAATGTAPSAVELLASSLARLARGVERLNAEVQGSPGMMLFAGRRASSRLYLILQNWYCRQHLRGYLGTSALLVAACLDELLLESGETEAQVAEEVGPLVGTLAHEIIMALGQLLARYDDLGASSGAGPERLAPAGGHEPVVGNAARVPSQGGGGDAAQITPLLAHLLLLRETGGLATATALSDTVGTRGFVCAALAARLPKEFLEDACARYPEQVRALPACVLEPDARVFDLFPYWRMDSGDYEEMACYVVRAWERRWSGTPEERRPPRPRFIHSNLKSYEQIVQLSRLPEEIRPAIYAFGTLADGFLPFDLLGNEQQEPAPEAPPAAARAAEEAGGSRSGSALCTEPAQPQPNGTQPGWDDAVPPLGSTEAPQVASAVAATGLANPRAEAGSSGVSVCNGSSGGSAVGGEECALPAGQGGEPGGRSLVEIKLCSVVAKAVQAFHPCLADSASESAGKLGDDVSGSKAQLDWRLPAQAQERVRLRMLDLARERQVDSGRATAALAAAYTAVTRQRVLAEEGGCC